MSEEKTRLKKVQTDQCRICGDEATFSYFGVIACHACKMFFKRNAEKQQKTLKCDFDGRCEVNLLTRHVCSPCRLQKCFDCGMQVEKIRPALAYRKAAKSSESSRSIVPTSHPNLFPTTNLLRADTSSLSTDQWTLLTNVTQLYDLSNIFHLTQRLGPSSSTVDTSIMKGLLSSFYEKAGEACRRNADYQTLSFADRSVLLPTAVDNITCLGGIFTCAQTQLTRHQGYVAYVNDLYGLSTINHHRWATTFVKCDENLFKLALALFAVSTHSRTFQRHLKDEYADVKTILNIESRYAELTWKYLLYKYTFGEAVVHVADVTSLIEEIEIKFILDDLEIYPGQTYRRSFSAALN